MTKDARNKNSKISVVLSFWNEADVLEELADRLVGIYKTNNTTKTVAINPRSFKVGANELVQREQMHAEEERANQNQELVTA